MMSVTLFTFYYLVRFTYRARRTFSQASLVILLSSQHLAASDPANTLTLLAFGDSLTQGYGLPAEDGFVPQLTAWLQATGKDIVVLNGGVSGDTTAGGAARVDWSLTSEISAVIVALGGNDALRGLPVEDAHKNLEAILNSIQIRGIPVLLVGIHAPTNFGASYAQALDTMYVELAKAYNITLFENFLQGVIETGDRQMVVQTYLQADALHPNAAGVKLIVARMGPEVLKMLAGIN